MFQARVEGYLSTVQQYEEEETKAVALSVLPLERLHSEAQEAVEIEGEFGDGSGLSYNDYLMESLARWFKGEFFTWVSSPPCWNCGRNSTTAMGMTRMSGAEVKHGAERIEQYVCPQCQAAVSFPRYNDPIKLMETRKGRCGEWANAFTCLCRALGFESRFVVDWTDHVWTEYYAAERGRWVHVDCCECIIDKPMLYEAGWGKQLSYILAIDQYGATDITRRYVRDWEAVLSRRKEIAEAALETYLDQTRKARSKLFSTAKVQELRDREEAERTELMRAVANSLTSETLPGRTTGTADWRQSRGETGGAPKPRVPRISSCRYRRVTLNDGEGGRKIIVRGSGENPPNETVVQLFDRKTTTKWLDFGGGGDDGTAWVEYCVPKNEPGFMIARYALLTANDCPERDPSEWEIEGLEEGCDSGQWVSIDRRSAIAFSRRQERRLFEVESFVRCRRIRLCIWKTRNPQTATAVQLAELEFFCRPDPTENGMVPGVVPDAALEGTMKDLFHAFQ